MLGLPDVAVGAILAAVLTSAVSLLGLIISKEQKTSEFRQAWIDSLRGEISALIAHTNAIHAAMVAQPSKWESVRADYVAINIAVGQIRLRLNPEEALSKKILAAIEELEVILTPGRPGSHTELNRVEKAMAKDAQALLKQEWNRVRRGELTFRLAKIAAFGGMAVLPLLLLAAYLLRR